MLHESIFISDDELKFLTDRQREIVKLRRKYNYREIAEITGLDIREAFGIFKQAVSKVKKIKRQKNAGIPIGLSPQQEKIYLLYVQGKKSKEIAEVIGSSDSSVRSQLNKIKKKILKTPSIIESR